MLAVRDSDYSTPRSAKADPSPLRRAADPVRRLRGLAARWLERRRRDHRLSSSTVGRGVWPRTLPGGSPADRPRQPSSAYRGGPPPPRQPSRWTDPPSEGPRPPLRRHAVHGPGRPASRPCSRASAGQEMVSVGDESRGAPARRSSSAGRLMSSARCCTPGRSNGRASEAVGGAEEPCARRPRPRRRAIRPGGGRRTGPSALAPRLCSGAFRARHHPVRGARPARARLAEITERGAAVFDLTMSLAAGKRDEVVGWLEYSSTDLFDRSTAERLAGFARLLSAEPNGEGHDSLQITPPSAERRQLAADLSSIGAPPAPLARPRFTMNGSSGRRTARRTPSPDLRRSGADLPRNGRAGEPARPPLIALGAAPRCGSASAIVRSVRWSSPSRHPQGGRRLCGPRPVLSTTVDDESPWPFSPAAACACRRGPLVAGRSGGRRAQHRVAPRSALAVALVARGGSAAIRPSMPLVLICCANWVRYVSTSHTPRTLML